MYKYKIELKLYTVKKKRERPTKTEKILRTETQGNRRRTLGEDSFMHMKYFCFS